MLLQIHYEPPDIFSYFMQFVALFLFFLLTFHFILYFHNHFPSQCFQALCVSYCSLCCCIRSGDFLDFVSLICLQLHLKYFSVWIFHH